MTSTIQIVLATGADIPSIASLDAAAYPGDSYNSGFLYQAILQWPQGLWVAKSSSAVLGYALTAPGQVATDAWLMAVIVAAQARGQGLGKKLCIACIESARQSQHRALYLTVAPDNSHAIRLYQKLGFQTLKTQPNALGSGIHRDVMQLMLDAPHS